MTIEQGKITESAPEVMLTRKEAARLARVSYNGIRFWEQQGRITPTRVMNGGVEEVRYPRSQIEAIMRERRDDTEESPEIIKLLKEQLADEKARNATLQEQYERLFERFMEILKH